MKNIKTTLKKTLSQKGFGWTEELFSFFPSAELYLVGGAVRDLFLSRETKDYDFVIRNVRSEDLQTFLETRGKTNLVGKSFGVFKFRPEDPELEDFDIALPRTEEAWGTGKYKDVDVQSDARLPIEDDLGRRDFTVNAIALRLAFKKGTLSVETIDPWNGLPDLEQKILRAVGDPETRFLEDSTRMLRAVRFACTLNFSIEKKTAEAIEKNAKRIPQMSPERVRDELVKIVMSPAPERGLNLLHDTGLLKHILPELETGVGVAQNKSHIYTVFAHLAKAVQAAADRGYSMPVRFAALFHDVAKPHTKAGEGVAATFHGHEHVGAKLTRNILTRLKFSNDDVKKITHLVRHHMFYYDLESVTDAGVRRLLARVGKENIHDLIQLRMADRLGMGRPKAKPYKLQTLERKLQEVQMDPITTSMLAIDGNDIMREFQMKPGPRLGLFLRALLGEVLEDKKKNAKKYLLERVGELEKLSDNELKKLEPDIERYETEQKKAFFKKYEEIS